MIRRSGAWALCKFVNARDPDGRAFADEWRRSADLVALSTHVVVASDALPAPAVAPSAPAQERVRGLDGEAWAPPAPDAGSIASPGGGPLPCEARSTARARMAAATDASAMVALMLTVCACSDLGNVLLLTLVRGDVCLCTAGMVQLMLRRHRQVMASHGATTAARLIMGRLVRRLPP